MLLSLSINAFSHHFSKSRGGDKMGMMNHCKSPTPTSTGLVARLAESVPGIVDRHTVRSLMTRNQNRKNILLI